jgi:hypothetical protein
MENSGFQKGQFDHIFDRNFHPKLRPSLSNPGHGVPMDPTSECYRLFPRLFHIDFLKILHTPKLN